MALVKSKSGPAAASMEPVGGDVASLLLSLSSDDARARRNAARELADHPQAAMALCDRLEHERGPSVRAVLFTSLIRLQSPDVAGRLAMHLRSDDAQLRNGAIEALQEMPDAIAPHLSDLLNDDDSDVRIFAVNILGALRFEEAPRLLTEVLRKESHINVCAAAVDALAEVGGMEAIEALEELRARFADDAFIVFAVDTAIRRIRAD